MRATRTPSGRPSRNTPARPSGPRRSPGSPTGSRRCSCISSSPCEPRCRCADRDIDRPPRGDGQWSGGRHGQEVAAAVGRAVPRGLRVVLGALSAFGPLSMALYLPALPQLSADLGSTEAIGQLTVTACMVGLALGQLLIGPVSDRY